MKQVGKKKPEQKKLDIRLRTMTNGYALEVNDEGYMYYNAQSLVEGFCIHVGMERVGAMTKEEIQAMPKAFHDGSLEKRLQAEVNELRAQIVDLKKEIREQKKVIKELKRLM